MSIAQVPINRLADMPLDGSVRFGVAAYLEVEQAVALEAACKTLDINRSEVIRQAVALWLDDVARAAEAFDIVRTVSPKAMVRPGR